VLVEADSSWLSLSCGPKEERLVITDPQAALNKLLKEKPRCSRMPTTRTVVVAIIVAALIALATIHMSKGEPLPTPSSIVTVRPDAR
jgi:hypothetical protein